MFKKNLFDIFAKEHVNIDNDQKYMHYCLYIWIHDVYYCMDVTLTLAQDIIKNIIA